MDTQNAAPAPEQHVEETEDYAVPRALKFTVIAMGFLLVGGLMLLLVGIAQKVAGGDSRKSGACQGVRINLRGVGEVIRVEEKDKEVIVWLKPSPNTVAVRHYHACTGAVLRDVLIEADKMP